MRWFWIMIFCVFGVIAAQAQDNAEPEDKGRITRYLEDALSGLGREVRIDGFQGALSSRVSMERLTVADADGVWLTLTDAVLDWNRAAILQGRINIDQISARRIEVARPPVAEGEASPEAASSFSLPELPVSIEIASLAVEEVALGAAFVGEPVGLSVEGGVTLVGGQGQAALAINRLDGPRGAFNLDAAYANDTRQLALTLTLDEAQDGLISTLLNLPGRPALELRVAGDAPIDDFTAEIALRSDGQDRLSGQVRTRTDAVMAAPDQDPQGLPRIVDVDIAGDLAPLFAPEYQPFFGPEVALASLVRLFPDGRVTLENLALEAAALRLRGQAMIAADGMPARFDLQGVLEDPDQGLILLPLSGPETRVARAAISAGFDADKGDAWTLRADLTGLERPDMTLDNVRIDGHGAIRNAPMAEVTARFDAAVQGIGLKEPALARAIGDRFGLTGEIAWREGAPLDVTDLSLTGEGLKLSGAGVVDGLETAITFDGALAAQVEDIARFSDLAGRSLSGGVEARLDGKAALLTGAFDMELTALGTDLTVGIEQVDAALAGATELSVSGKRDESGVTLRAANITSGAGRAAAEGFINTGQTHFSFEAALDDLARFVEGIAGPVTLSGEATEHDTGWLIDVDGAGPFQSSATGRLAVPHEGEPSVKLTGAVGNVGALLPDLPGRADFTANARQQGENWALDVSGQGPGGSTFAVAGQMSADATQAALDIDGTLPLALANRRIKPNAAQGMAQFDLRLDGPVGLSSLSGQLSTTGARLSLPALQNALSDIDATISLNGRSAGIRASAGVSTGGRITTEGQVAIAAPFTTNLAVQIRDAVIRDPKLYETTAQGDLVVTGAAPDSLNIAGAINLDRTEIRIPSTGFGGGAIPEIDHVNEPAGVRKTRNYAGLTAQAAEAGAQSGGVGVGLDVLVVADNKIFVRGRGLDAELGGRFRVTGTTNDIIPIGGLELIRGRLDVLGKRLVLDEGRVRLQGDFVPALRLVASTVSDDDTVVRVIIAGRADAPEVSFTSEPELPDDEVLARLLFGRDLGSLSAFQALQLASAVATLAGRGGAGLAERIRQNTGLDDFDVSNDGEGGTTVGVGKYISDKVYTDVQIGDQSNTEINLNIDLSRRTRLRGQLGSDGSTGVGIFFEKDY